MMIDLAFVDAAKTAQLALRAAEGTVLDRRRAFETAVRRLYVEGASIREIAAHLNLSHQRVHQLIGARQSWWRRITGHEVPAPRDCSFCGRGADAVAKLIAGPSVHICDRCADQAASQRAGSDPGTTTTRFTRLARSSRQRCSFCGRREGIGTLLAASGHQICESCLGQVQAIARP
ncbi:MAG: ClpX C4-type zinc finger protein [Geminicoccaceae bacterium]